MKLVCLLLMVSTLALTAGADWVRLKNGRTLEGVIEDDRPEAVTLRMGVATVTLKRSQIAELGRSQSDAALEEDWRQKYLFHARYVPAGYEETARRFQEVDGARSEAVKAHAEITALRREQESLRAEIDKLDAELAAVSRELAAASPRQVSRYNDLVAENNRLGAQGMVKRHRLVKNEEKIDADVESMSEYLRRLDEYRDFFATRQEQHLASQHDEQASLLMDTIRQKLDQFDEERHTVQIPTDQFAGHVVVDAVINGTSNVRLLVDTGASVVTLSRLAALRTGLELKGDGTVLLSMADGSKAKVEPVLLSTLRVGEAESRNVQAAVMEATPANGIDGLLGMSFLHDYLMEYDASSRRVLLTRFEPE